MLSNKESKQMVNINACKTLADAVHDKLSEYFRFAGRGTEETEVAVH